MRGSLDLSDNQTWLVPVWLQLLCSGIIATFILFMPESPRWLFVNGKESLAMEVVAKYHGMGNSKSCWVTLQEQEYRESLHHNGAVAVPHPFKETQTFAYSDRTSAGGTTVPSSAIGPLSTVSLVTSR